jgi:hypothetical protein
MIIEKNVITWKKKEVKIKFQYLLKQTIRRWEIIALLLCNKINILQFIKFLTRRIFSTAYLISYL